MKQVITSIGNDKISSVHLGLKHEMDGVKNLNYLITVYLIISNFKESYCLQVHGSFGSWYLWGLAEHQIQLVGSCTNGTPAMDSSLSA